MLPIFSWIWFQIDKSLDLMLKYDICFAYWFEYRVERGTIKWLIYWFNIVEFKGHYSKLLHDIEIFENEKAEQ